MNSKERVKRLLEQAKQALDIEDSIKLVLYPMKYKVASVSLKTRTIRINRRLVEAFDDEELYYILVHELIHIKIMSLSHGKSFYKLLDKLYPTRSDEIENQIIRKLLEIGINTKRWLT